MTAGLSRGEAIPLIRILGEAGFHKEGSLFFKDGAQTPKTIHFILREDDSRRYVCAYVGVSTPFYARFFSPNGDYYPDWPVMCAPANLAYPSDEFREWLVDWDESDQGLTRIAAIVDYILVAAERASTLFADRDKLKKVLVSGESSHLITLPRHRCLIVAAAIDAECGNITEAKKLLNGAISALGPRSFSKRAELEYAFKHLCDPSTSQI